MKTDKVSTRQLVWTLPATALAFMLVVGLALLLSHLQVQAQPRTEAMQTLLVEKQVNTVEAIPGETLVYTITVYNGSDLPVTTWLTDELPSELVYVPGSLDTNHGSPILAGGVITWNETIWSKQTVDVWFSAQIPLTTTAAEIENTVQVTGTGELITHSVSTEISSVLDSDDTYKAVSQEQVRRGQTFTYTLVLRNNSAISAVTALLTDPLNPLLDYVSDSAHTIPDGSGTLLDTDGITWTVTISKSTSVTLTFQAQVSEEADDGALITNTATIHDGSRSFERSVTVAMDPPPTSQIRSPEKLAAITEKGTLTIEGVAWDGDERPDFPPDPVLSPINNEGSGTYYVTWDDVPTALGYTVEEADNPKFSDPTTSDLLESPQYGVSDKSPGTYYYRVKAHNASGSSRWSNVESVVVQTTRALGFLLTPSNLSAPAMPDRVADSNSLTVWVRIDSGEWQTTTVTQDAGGWWNWTYEWTPPEELNTPHTIQTQARDTSGNLSAIDTITVTVDNQAYILYFPLYFKRFPPVPYPPTLNDIDNDDDGKGNGDGDYTVSWSYDHATLTPSSYTLQEARDVDFTNPTEYHPGSATSQPIDDQEPGTYYYRVQGHNTYGAGEWSAIKTAKVTPPPYAPVLSNIDDSDGDGNYIVKWSYNYTYPPADTYTLQEAKNASFSENLITYEAGSNKQWAISGKDIDTYYYRVRGNNVSGAGSWSAVKAVTVRPVSFHYGFNSSSKLTNPWPIRRTSYWKGDEGKDRVTWTEEHDGSLFVVIDDKWDFTIASPMEEAPSPPYVISVRAQLHDDTYLRGYGVIFGGNSGSPCPAYRDTGCFSHYYRLQVVAGAGALKADFKRVDYHEPESSDDRGKGRGVTLVSFEGLPGKPEAWNKWDIKVKPDGIDLYLNDILWHSVDDTKYVNEPYFGVYTANDEFRPGIGRFDYYNVDPDD